ncbi:MAG: glutamine synthetase, partial [Firmicutes bacterium]|nr:glutamine synthetase [Bacillota bacterium]
MPSELPRAFETGVSFDASSILGFAPVDKSDLFLFPDAATLSVLPWRPQTGRVVRFFCSVRTADGSPYGADGRHILRRTLRRLADAGYECRVGAECEFYLFERDAEGRPTKRPQDNGGYFDVAPLDRGENVRREICLTLEEMNIRPESSHHEQGPGQNEVDFKHAAPLTAADDVITFKNVVKTVAARNGLYGSFSPKPLADKPGSGMHVNISLARGGRNIFAPGPDGAYSPAMRSFIAGVLARAGEICAFTNPVPGSYARFGSFEAPRYVAWSHQNRSQLIRIPAAEGEFRRAELRSADPMANPYIAFALLIHAGLDGIKGRLNLPEPADINLYTAPQSVVDSYRRLPASLTEAAAAAAKSEFIAKHLPEAVAQAYFRH